MMVSMNVIKAGGYLMILNELANQMKQFKNSRTEAVRQNRTRNLIVGVGIGSAVGVAAGILFAPKSGRETRHLIAGRTVKTVKNLRDNVAAAKEKMCDSAAEKKEEYSE
jgi:hypothetical protein